MFSLKLSLISVIIALNVINSFCDTNESFNQSKALNTSPQIIGSSHKSNENNSSTASMVGHIHITNGLIVRSLFVVSVILTAVLLICMIRVYYSSRRWKRSKVSKEWTQPKYDSLPTVAINDSIKKNAFVLNDSEDEDFTIFDAKQRLIK